MPEPEIPKPKKSPRKSSSHVYETNRSSPEWRSKLSEAMRESGERRREKNRERDEKIVRMYGEDNATMREISSAFGLSFKTVMDILHRARDEGLVAIRPAAKRIRR